MNLAWRGLMLVLLAAPVPAVLACGYCIEDKIAGVYDHAVATRAFSQKHQIVFFAIEGTFPPGENARHVLETIAESAFSVDKGSARVSVESASLSVAFDPARMSLTELERSLSRKIAPKKLSFAILRTMDKPAELKPFARR